ncbi:MAG: anhydro-N-acetylmuramic acid kinase [Alphaproteobacteria bacterium]|nr:anhydro-N-acetylmuramic acid kinase [Alphaproteobacteria bacterium]
MPASSTATPTPPSGPGIRRAIGVISGTSMDGIDVAVVETDGENAVRTGPGHTYPYPPALRRELLAIAADAQRAEHAPLAEADAAVSESHAEAIAQFMRANGMRPADIALVGLHGQTILHRPERRFTRQLGSGAEVARRLGIATVDRFRHADVAAGGQGAPFAPLYHRALAAAAKLQLPLMVLNLGGVGNVTYIDDATTIAFDTGPASALLDDWILRHTGAPYDADGAIAASGQVDSKLLAELMAHPYFALPAPKSLDRNDFHARARVVENLGLVDGAATLAAFTIESVADALRHVPRAPTRWLVTGGGRRNGFFMRALAKRLGVAVDPVEAVGWDGDFIEAQCFGYLAVRSLRGLPLSVPTTTGVPKPMTGGMLHRPG